MKLKMMAAIMMLVLLTASPNVAFAEQAVEADVNAPVYSVVFANAAGEPLSQMLVEDGGEVWRRAPQAPEREGYAFVGWQSDCASTLHKIVADTMFTAQYTPLEPIAPEGEAEWPSQGVEPEAQPDDPGMQPEDADETGEPEAFEAGDVPVEPQAVHVPDEPEEGVVQHGQHIEIERIAGEFLRIGDRITLKAVLFGFDDAEYVVQWQYDAGDGWMDVEGENGLTLTLAVDRSNINHGWRVLVTPMEP